MKNDNLTSLITKSEINSICDRLGSELTRDYQGKDLVIICILKGGFIFAADLVRRLPFNVQLDFIRLASYQGTNSTGKVDLVHDVTTKIEGRHILIVEDILDTGNTLTFLKSEIEKRKPASLKICTFLDKPSRRTVTFEADYVGKKIDDLFVVGYGLDFNEKFRNLPEVFVLNP